MAENRIPRYLDPEQIIPISRQSTEVTKTGEWSVCRPVFAEKASPCRVDCPNGNNIPRALFAAAGGDFDGALAAFLEESPLPGVCGLVCHHPCQGSCNRIAFDGAVSVRLLERAAAAFGKAAPSVLSAAGKDQPVAVVGAGPAGIAAAYHLARLGHPVTLFEEADELGGLLLHGIPEFRLPKAILRRELARLRVLPIELRTGVRIEWEALSAMQAEYRATFLAVGAQSDLALRVAGEDLGGVGSALEFLQRPELQTKARGARVVVIGGGNTAMDAARVALRRGAAEVRVLYRRGTGDLPAFPDEVDEAREEGVQFRFHAGPAAFLGEEGRVSAIRCFEVRPAGRGEAAVPLPGSEFELACDLVLSATGQVPLLASAPADVRLQGGRVWVDASGQTTRSGLFAGGDLADSRGSVVDALASGKRAAAAIHLSLLGGTEPRRWLGAELGGGPALSLQAMMRPPARWEPASVVRLDELDYVGCETRAVAPVRRKAVGERLSGFDEVSLAPSREEAWAEAERCFFCGTCAGCEKCNLYCPDGSMERQDEAGSTGKAYLYDNAYCKGCGTCAEACVRGVLTMREGGEVR
jgi:NADPH-dependent glutamate synthase beta subunit-like oxidoreductase/ferredoxin